ncbi:ferredoxin--NADP reductase [Leucothrix arctica]|uniref:ferredoxin--NADP(+) reductase n=1 Tax=Leucothrix arctica TaxID=1481894 RepID=A0A317CR93_9GAMM|nr:ferredoxin--NADP reductase [Leucothrix arctica]PWQ98812.1 ferredoxin--NADP(+) reductase [Leucothrix arctica]
MPSAFLSATVIENFKWADNLFSLKLSVELGPSKAGQFIRLKLKVGDEYIAKPYSLVNPPNEKYAEVLYNTVKDGVMSHALSTLKSGDMIEISQPAVGFFVIEEVPDCKHLWMMATGTGLGPYLSILQAPRVWERFEKIVLVHAVSYENNLAYEPLIQQLSDQHPEQLSYIRIVSQEKTSDALQGRIPALIVSCELEEKAGVTISTENSQVMLCGNQHMIADTRALLKERGLKKHLRRSPGHITTEQYF